MSFMRFLEVNQIKHLFWEQVLRSPLDYQATEAFYVENV